MADDQKSSRRKDVTRSLRMSAEEHELFGEFCAGHGITPSEALRRLARSAALLGPTFSGEAQAEIVALTRQIRAVGVNLNQAVHHMNAGHLIQGEELKNYLDGVAEAIGELDRLYRSLCVNSYRRAVAAVAEPAA
jgi:soluble cytochrome b562